jgi:hypothetical protein
MCGDERPKKGCAKGSPPLLCTFMAPHRANIFATLFSISIATMSKNRQLPLWVHRIFNGLLPAALLAGFGTFWISEPGGSWRGRISMCLLWSSIPVGVIFAALTHRFSIVEGVAGEVGYENDPSDKQNIPGSEGGDGG